MSEIREQVDDAVTIDTRPGGPVSAWGQALHFLDADVPARAGECLTLRARTVRKRSRTAVKAISSNGGCTSGDKTDSCRSSRDSI